jgi:hypothetical protein
MGDRRPGGRVVRLAATDGIEDEVPGTMAPEGRGQWSRRAQARVGRRSAPNDASQLPPAAAVLCSAPASSSS